MSAVGQEFKLHATKYHPGQGGAGWVTASGDRINYDKLKNYQIRWVALSHDMFKSLHVVTSTTSVTDQSLSARKSEMNRILSDSKRHDEDGTDDICLVLFDE